MSYKVDYVFRTDKANRKYALRIDLKTGKKERIPYKKARKLDRDVQYRRNRSKIEKEIKESGTNATYKEYKTVYKKVEKEIIESRKKPLTKGTLHATVKRKTIYERIGISTSFRFMWVYRILHEYIDNDGIAQIKCESPEFTWDSGFRDGNEFEIQKDICIDAYKYIKSNKLCSLEGGACVVLINKDDKSIIEQFEIGKGCGFSFQFNDVHGNYIYHLHEGYVCTEETF